MRYGMLHTDALDSRSWRPSAERRCVAWLRHGRWVAQPRGPRGADVRPGITGWRVCELPASAGRDRLRKPCVHSSRENSRMNTIRFIMLGGFLGAGKTTAM